MSTAKYVHQKWAYLLTLTGPLVALDRLGSSRVLPPQNRIQCSRGIAILQRAGVARRLSRIRLQFRYVELWLHVCIDGLFSQFKIVRIWFQCNYCSDFPKGTIFPWPRQLRPTGEDN